MSTRDELANRVRDYFDDERDGDRPDMLADALIAEGWRKKLSREELARAFWRGDDESWNSPFDAAGRENAYRLADNVLALMDRGQ